MLSKFSILAATASAHFGKQIDRQLAATFDYAQNGADWGGDCIGGNQSPIDVVSYKPDSDEEFPYKIYPATLDKYRKSYSNQYNSVFTFTGYTTQVDLDPNDGINAFTSQISSIGYDGQEEYNGIQFHFHAGSEHTIDGKQYDFEMHTVHYTPGTSEGKTFAEQPGGIGAAAVGIMFSVEDYTANLSWAEQQIVDNFFDSLVMSDLGTETSVGSGKYTHNIDLALYGNLMQLVDNNNRWVYLGSVTTPPCAKYVYWNLLSTIYPISKRHLDQFKAQLNIGENGQLDERGNYRVINPATDEHKVAYVSTGGQGDDKDVKRGLIAGVITLGVVAFILIISVICVLAKCCKKSEPKASYKKEDIELQQEDAPESQRQLNKE